VLKALSALGNDHEKAPPRAALTANGPGIERHPEDDMSINLSVPKNAGAPDLKPRIAVIGVGGAGGNAVNNMILSELEGVEFIVANTDAQALAGARTDRRIQLGKTVTQGLGAGSRPDIGRAAAEEALDDIGESLRGANMVFIAAGMGGGTGTGAAPVIAKAAREQGALTVGVVTKPFHFEGVHRMRVAEAGIEELEGHVDTLIIIPNQNLFRIANEKTTFAEAFSMADEVLYSGVRGVTDLMVMPGLINLDFADIRTVMTEMGRAMMGTGEAEGERRALDAAEAAINNPLLDEVSMKGAKGVLINITGGMDMTLFEVDEAANRIRSEVDEEAYIIFGSAFDASLDGKLRVSVVATGMDAKASARMVPAVLTVPAPRAVARPERRPVEKPAAAAAERPAVGAEQESPPPAPAAQAEPPADAQAAETMAAEAPSTDSAPVFVAEVDPAEAPVSVTGGGPLPEPVKPPAATPSVGALDAFIPPQPVDPADGAIGLRPEPFAAAAMINGAKEPPSDEPPAKRKSTWPSLFERVTGTGRAARARFSRAQHAQADHGTAGEARKEAPPAQPRLRGLDPSERLVGPRAGEEDLLDIPAFLRRQAN
jgi:cell division protein FtsZ